MWQETPVFGLLATVWRAMRAMAGLRLTATMPQRRLLQMLSPCNWPFGCLLHPRAACCSRRRRLACLRRRGQLQQTRRKTTARRPTRQPAASGAAPWRCKQLVHAHYKPRLARRRPHLARRRQLRRRLAQVAARLRHIALSPPSTSRPRYRRRCFRSGMHRMLFARSRSRWRYP